MENTELRPLQIEDKIIELRNQKVILDYHVATLYKVQTMRVNEAVKNNPDKFPEGYVFELQTAEKQEVIENFDNLKSLKFSPKNPVAFTERGLYMLATILKSPQATQTTIAIVEAFAKLKQLSHSLIALNTMEPEAIEPEIVETTGGLLNDLLFWGLPTSAETSVELNLGVIKLKRSLSNGRRDGMPLLPASATGHLQKDIDDLKKLVEKMNDRLEQLNN